jgi:mono/diheme cytochrome c family protein
MTHRIRTSLAALALAGGAAILGITPLTGPARAADKVDFTKDIKPIFEHSCIKCHRVNPDEPKKKPKGGFRLDDKAAALKGGESGVAIVPGKGADSLLYKLLLGPVKTGDDEVAAMPKQKKGEEWKALPQAQIDLIKAWIDQGAEWP